MSLDEEQRKFEAKLDEAARPHCRRCGHECERSHKACGVCGAKLAGKVLDSPDSCKHSPVTDFEPRCTNCGQKP